LPESRRSFTQNADQVPAHRAANAAVVHLDDLLAGLVQEDLVVDARLAELVLDHRDAMSVLLLQDTVDECGLSAPQKPGEYGHRNHVFLYRHFDLLACSAATLLERAVPKKFESGRTPADAGAAKKGRITACSR
jgi:hypothetical protein